MRKISILAIIVFFSCTTYGQNWTLIKDTTSPIIEIPLEFDSIYRQPLSTLGWEDGLHISDDGLSLYCTYLPIDFLSFVLNGDLPNNFTTSYLRGAPTFGMDLISNPIGSFEWLHSDILYAYRSSVLDSFNSWTLSNMARNFYSEGAPTPTFVANTNTIEFMLFTSNDNAINNSDIWIINNTSENPSGIGSPMSLPINTTFNEDNPQLIRLNSNELLLFFDSNNLPGGAGDIDIWFSESADYGITWNTPTNVSTLNTDNKEHQPFLHQDLSTGNWFLYYSAFHSDGKLAIFRTQQMTNGNWNSWGTSELVISAGNCAGIGEPTLTEYGDISFVVVYADPNVNSIYNRFDVDPWMLQKKNTITGINNNPVKTKTYIYPNPTNDIINIHSKELITQIQLYNITGKLLLIGSEKTIELSSFTKGIYFVKIQFASGETETIKLIKQ